jgi:hypothetical protein
VPQQGGTLSLISDEGIFLLHTYIIIGCTWHQHYRIKPLWEYLL